MNASIRDPFRHSMPSGLSPPKLIKAVAIAERDRAAACHSDHVNDPVADAFC
jgi:hypothetical protein